MVGFRSWLVPLLNLRVGVFVHFAVAQGVMVHIPGRDRWQIRTGILPTLATLPS